MGWFSRQLRSQLHQAEAGSSSNSAPPAWAPADEPSRAYGLKNEAPKHEFEAAEDFCDANPPYPPRFLPSADVDRIRAEGCKAWTLVPPNLSRFRGSIREVRSRRKGEPKVVELVTEARCGDSCVVSNYPITGGLYDTQGKEGVYYEVTILQMEGLVAIGTACLPYPEYRFPGWNRLSAGLHLDDFQKFFEDPNGGRPYDTRLVSISPGETIGCGYVFATGTVFFTYNGMRLSDAFRGVYLPRTVHDVYAAIGVGGPGQNRLRVNFGGDDDEHLFRWMPGREWSWLVDGHVGRLGSGAVEDEELPTYAA